MEKARPSPLARCARSRRCHPNNRCGHEREAYWNHHARRVWKKRGRHRWRGAPGHADVVLITGGGMSEKRIGIIMHGVTGRMGTNQHLVRSIVEIRRQGGVQLADGTRLMPDPVLVGRNREKVEALARTHGIERWTTDLPQALADERDTVFF